MTYAEKWERTGLLKGLSPIQAEKLSRIFEREAAALFVRMPEADQGYSVAMLDERLKPLAFLVFPILRRAFARSVIHCLVENDVVYDFTDDDIPCADIGFEFSLDFLKDPSHYTGLDAELALTWEIAEAVINFISDRQIVVGRVPLEFVFNDEGKIRVFSQLRFVDDNRSASDDKEELK